MHYAHRVLYMFKMHIVHHSISMGLDWFTKTKLSKFWSSDSCKVWFFKIITFSLVIYNLYYFVVWKCVDGWGYRYFGQVSCQQIQIHCKVNFSLKLLSNCWLCFCLFKQYIRLDWRKMMTERKLDCFVSNYFEYNFMQLTTDNYQWSLCQDKSVFTGAADLVPILTEVTRRCLFVISATRYRSGSVIWWVVICYFDSSFDLCKDSKFVK